jgi:4-aminobutyrate aminotransferase
MLGRANTLGTRLRSRLEALRKVAPRLAEGRRPGAMIAVELMRGAIPDADEARAIQGRALEQGLLLLTCGSDGNVLRFLLPLTIQDEVFEEALGIFDAAVRA